VKFKNADDFYYQITTKGWYMSSLSRKIGKCESFISKAIERNHVTKSNAEKICMVLGVEVKSLFLTNQEGLI